MKPHSNDHEPKGKLRKKPRVTSESVWFALLVSKYSTPLAVWLVSLALFFYRPKGNGPILCVGLLVFGAILNMIYPYLIKDQPEVKPWVAYARMSINLGINAVFVYVLGDFWPPIWLLLALTPVATAIYGTRRKTVIASTAVGFLLLVIQALRPFTGTLEWAQQISYALFIMILSLIINDLARLAKSRVSVLPPASV